MHLLASWPLLFLELLRGCNVTFNNHIWSVVSYFHRTRKTKYGRSIAIFQCFKFTSRNFNWRRFDFKKLAMFPNEKNIFIIYDGLSNTLHVNKRKLFEFNDRGLKGNGRQSTYRFYPELPAWNVPLIQWETLFPAHFVLY